MAGVHNTTGLPVLLGWIGREVILAPALPATPVAVFGRRPERVWIGFREISPFAAAKAV